MRPALAILLIITGVLIVLWNPWRPRDVSLTEDFMPLPVLHYPPATPVATAPTVPPHDAERSLLADGLNRTTGNIENDLRILLSLFAAYRNVLHENPDGTNREITNALSGGNNHFHAPLPRDHPAISTNGELCDRWGSPFHFHILSPDQLEVRSAGPDGHLGTDDDTMLSTPILSSR